MSVMVCHMIDRLRKPLNFAVRAFGSLPTLSLHVPANSIAAAVREAGAPAAASRSPRPRCHPLSSAALSLSPRITLSPLSTPSLCCRTRSAALSAGAAARCFTSRSSLLSLLSQ